MHPLLLTMALGPAGALEHPPGALITRRESYGRGRPRSPRDPCSCRLAGPHGTDLVRPQPLRACENPSLTAPASSGDTPTAPTKLDALVDAAELQFADSVARYSHADWEREQQAEPACHAAMRYITIGRPPALPPHFCRATPRTSVPPFWTSRNWLAKDDYTRPTSSYSSVIRRHRHRPTSLAR